MGEIKFVLFVLLIVLICEFVEFRKRRIELKLMLEKNNKCIEENISLKSIIRFQLEQICRYKLYVTMLEQNTNRRWLSGGYKIEDEELKGALNMLLKMKSDMWTR